MARSKNKPILTEAEKKARKCEIQQAYYQRNKVRLLENVKQWRKKNRRKMMDTRRRFTFGEAAVDHYKECEKSQRGLCKICGDIMKKPQQDHCHLTGKLRDLLCERCNKGLGHFKDDLVRIAKAQAYLLFWQEMNIDNDSDEGWLPRTMSAAI